MWEAPEVVSWMDICIFLPLTVLFICCVCCAEQRDQALLIYYKNLLISNLIQLCIMIFWWAVLNYDTWCIIYCCGAMANLYFKMCIALERYFFITCSQLDCLRQTTGSVLVCVLVWALCVVSVALAIVLEELLCLIIFSTLPAPLFIFCFTGTLKALPAATSVPTEEKQRIVGSLILLLLNYSLMNLTAVILLTLNLRPRRPVTDIDLIILVLFLFGSLLDLILFAFKCKGPIDRLLACVCCCSMENSRNSDVTDVSTERWIQVVRDKRREKTHDGRDEHHTN